MLVAADGVSLELGGAADSSSSPEPCTMSSPPSDSSGGVSEPSGCSSSCRLGGCRALGVMSPARGGEPSREACRTVPSLSQRFHAWQPSSFGRRSWCSSTQHSPSHTVTPSCQQLGVRQQLLWPLRRAAAERRHQQRTWVKACCGGACEGRRCSAAEAQEEPGLLDSAGHWLAGFCVSATGLCPFSLARPPWCLPFAC